MVCHAAPKSTSVLALQYPFLRSPPSTILSLTSDDCSALLPIFTFFSFQVLSLTSQNMTIVFVFPRLIILVLSLPLLLISISSTRISSASFSSSSPSPGTCDRRCGNKSQVQYPFGFSPDCEIRLNCTVPSGEITIGQFQVQNVTGDSLLINLPPVCNRKISELNQLRGPNFAMTRRNGLLFYNCSEPVNGCSVPIALLSSTLDMKESCRGIHANNTSCYSGAGKNSSEFFDYDYLKQINCGVVFSSIAVAVDDTNHDSRVSTALSLNFQTLELGWWLDGHCLCHEGASCTTFSTPSGGRGYRCRCNEGFFGDGFLNGGGCKRGRRGGTTRVGALVGGILGMASLMVVSSLLCYCIRKRLKLLKSRMRARRLLGEAAGTGSSSISLFPYKDIERATLGFSDKRRLGTGAYGTVYAGKLHNDEWVAIKKINHRGHGSIERVVNEIKLLSSVSHPNLVRLLGCCIENGEQILVYEFMPNGTLYQHLHRQRGSGLPWTIRLNIAIETAHAIAHLHSAINPPVYHRDIKSNNILLDYNYKSKVADFGLSRLGVMDDSHVSTSPRGTPGYLDPQYHQNFHLSDKSDVYSFGVVLVEIIAALRVVDFSRAHTEINLAALAIDRIGKGRLNEIIDPFLELHRDAWTLSSIHEVAELACRCLAFRQDMRPSMMEVADELEQIKLGRWAAPDENIWMASSAASSCSSPFNGSGNPFNGRTTKKTTGMGSSRTNVSQRGGDSLSTMEETNESSSASVQDPWLSLLSNIVH